MPNFEMVAKEQQGDSQSAQACSGVTEDHRPAPFPAVYEGPGQRRDNEARQCGKHRDKGELGDRPRTLKNPYPQGKTGEMGAEQRNELPEPDQNKSSYIKKPCKGLKPSQGWSLSLTDGRESGEGRRRADKVTDL